MPQETLFINGRFFDTDASANESVSFAEYLHVKDGVISSIGLKTDPEYTTLKERCDEPGPNSITTHDLQERIILPGFIDGHVHFLLLGQSLQKVDLFQCKTLEEIRTKLKEYAVSHPDEPRIMGKGWMRAMINEGKTEAKAHMLDDIDPRPVFLDSKDLHSTWCNGAALEEMGVADMKDPKGGVIARDEQGKPCGLLNEAVVVTTVWPHLARVASMEEKKTALKAALAVYTAAGYTGCIDMAMDENAWEALLELRREAQAANETLPLRLSAYWIITPSEDHATNAAQVDRAISLSKQYNRQVSPDLCVVGIKLICDGIIDACTAHLTQPYSTNIPSPEPIWLPEMIDPVVKKADEAGLQCALHAIGDATVHIAINAIEQNGTPDRRHRLEHIEVSSPEDAARLGKLGITASIQPVHSDPYILRAWPNLLGKDRLKRAFAYKDFADGGAPLAIGSDSPTAPHDPLRNLYVATTRRSAHAGGEADEPVNPEQALGMCQAVSAATRGTAYSVFAEERVGSLRKGLFADFVVVDMAWESGRLLDARVGETWFAGKRVY